jgi:hypothetical protein
MLHNNLPAHIQEQLAALPPLVAPRQRGRQVQPPPAVSDLYFQFFLSN